MDTFTKAIYQLLGIGSWVSLLAGGVSLYLRWQGILWAGNYWIAVLQADLAVMVVLFLLRVGYGIVRRMQSVKQ